MFNIRMINLLFIELKLIAQYRNISNYENKSKEELIKALNESKPKLRIKKNKLKEIKEDFYNLRHRFSKNDLDKYRKVFYDIKNYRHLSELEIEEVRKNLNELEKSLMLKKFNDDDDIDSVFYEDLDNYDGDDFFYPDEDKYRKIERIRAVFKRFDIDYYKPMITDRGFDGRENNYIEYMNKGDKYKNYHLKNILIWLDHI